MWHASSRSGVATLRTAIHWLLTYLLTRPDKVRGLLLETRADPGQRSSPLGPRRSPTSPRTLSGRVRSGPLNGIQLLISKAQSVIIHGRPQRVNRHLPRKFSRNNNEIKSQHAQKFLEDQDCSFGDIHAVYE